MSISVLYHTFGIRGVPCQRDPDTERRGAKAMAWKPFILNWHSHRISTGKLEASNRKIGILQRNAYGYRDDEYLKLRIFNLHNTTCALTG